MSTSSCIGIKTKQGIKSIYCHWDGYPIGVGAVLQEHYQDPDKIDRLMDMVCVEFIEEELEDIEKLPCPVEVPMAKDTEEWLENIKPWVECIYLYRDGAWYCMQWGRWPTDWDLLKDLLEEEASSGCLSNF